MKFPLAILFACSSLALAVERPVGFLGVAWGASPEEAKRVLQKRPGVTFPENADDYKIELTGGTFAGQAVAKWVIEFPDRKFAVATVTLKTDSNASTVYKEFRNQLVSKYGSVTTDKRTGGTSKKGAPPQPVTMSSIWKFPPTMKDKNSVVISAEIAGATMKGNEETGGTVTIKYVNETLTGAAAAAISGKPAPKTTAPVKKEEL
jgi:hypothetical protein